MNRTVQQTSAAKGAEKTAAAASRYGGRRPFAVQTKLSVGAPGDRYEQEADRVAEQVMRMPAGDATISNGTPPCIQRLCTACKAGLLGGEAEEERTVQRSIQEGGAAVVDSGLSKEISSLGGSGQPLPAFARVFFEPRFGQDFSAVRVHTDQRAAETARALSARAYTFGNHVAFASGQYAPDTSPGKHLLAHELTHVTQQNGTATGANGDRTQETGVRVAGKSGRRIQRQADFSQIPAGLRCSTSGPVTRSGGEDILFAVGTNALSAAAIGQITNVVTNWRTNGSRDDIAIDGYASIDGPQGLNWRLSCDRTESVEADLVRQGVRAAHISKFAHGETNEFSRSSLAQNRRAVVSMTGPLAPLPPTPQPRPGTPATPVNLDRVEVEPGNQGDFPSVPGTGAGTHWVGLASLAAGKPVVRAVTNPVVPSSDQRVAGLVWSGPGVTPVSGDPLRAQVDRTVGRRPVTATLGANSANTTLWSVFAAITPSGAPVVTTSTTATRFNGTARINFTANILPTPIITDADRPNLSGANTVNPPDNGTHSCGRSLTGGADHRWDFSRMIRLHTLNPAGLAPTPASDACFWSNAPNYPAVAAEGNDDTHATDENNDPYANAGQVTSRDTPTDFIRHTKGSDGDTFEARKHFREFVRLELGGQWRLISNYQPWRFHFKTRKDPATHRWVNDGSDAAVDNSGF